MFQQLNASCQEDYDKLVKNKHKFIGSDAGNGDKSGDINVNRDVSGNENKMAVENDNKYVINIHYDNKKDDLNNSNKVKLL